ncbi:hypothetical protein TTHT_1677 [Thermotomaculum hydrothermale]|uniref:Type II secretion system protein GspF domain-containing protein n=1 Tax=Thermotomaculum hydrothermale TaxID=981385 RepID=A0A7R6PYG2_9BACT|nr:type II secretion system F family protein [Thermotomaculum hydrothermale]BBB33155.1 hypothetical protein TTHT_1677 [Thermotomaculum hydrothermale]
MRKSLIYQSLSNGFSSGSSVVDLFLPLGGRFKKVVKYLEEGLSLEESVKKAKFPIIECVFLTIGEQTGNLEGVCSSLSRYYAIKENFFSKIISLFLKTFFILFLGIVLSFILFKSTGSEVPHSLFVFDAFLIIVWFLILFLFIFINPGFSKYLSVFLVRNAYQAGLSFLDIKKLLSDLGFFYNKKAEYFADLISLKKEYRIFIQGAEKSGTLDSAFNKLVGILEEDYINKLNSFEKIFFYLSVISAAIVVFYSIYLFAVTSFSKVFDGLF